MNDDRPSRYYFPFVKRRSNWKGSAIKLAIFGNKYAIDNESARERERQWEEKKTKEQQSEIVGHQPIFGWSCQLVWNVTRQQSAHKTAKAAKKGLNRFLGQVKIMVEANVVTNSSPSLFALNFRCLIKLLCDVNGSAHSTAFRTMYFMCKTSFSDLFAALPFVCFSLLFVCWLFLQDSICLFTCV